MTTAATCDPTPAREAPLLEVHALQIVFPAGTRADPSLEAYAVDGVSFTVARGESVCVVGESG